jgi:hypothetical protein
MAKVRGVPRAFQGTRAIPGQYTTDPDIATPEQIRSIGASVDKAKRIGRGERVETPMPQGKPIVSSLKAPATSSYSGNSPSSPSAISLSKDKAAPDIVTSPTVVNYSSGAKGTPIKKNFAKLDVGRLTDTQAASVKMLKKP